MRRYKNRHIGKSHNNHIHRWTVSYADYMTLMFALFVVLYAVSLNKEEKYQQMIEVIQSATQFVTTKDPKQTGETINEAHSGSDASGILTKRSNDIKDQTGPALLADGQQYQQGFVSELPSEQLSSLDNNYTGKGLEELQLSLQSALQPELETGAFSIDLDGDWLTIEMSDALLFADESHTLLNGAKQQLEKVADVLKPVNNMLRLRGYTDSRTVANEIYKSNWELSALRAISVLHALNEKGIDGRRLAIEGYGKFQPVINDNGVENQLKSQRVVIAISKFALVQQAISKVVLSKPLDDKGQANSAVPDSEQIREIYLPDGRLIITTRQEE